MIVGGSVFFKYLRRKIELFANAIVEVLITHDADESTIDVLKCVSFFLTH